MKFYSTNNKSHLVGLEEAVMNGLAPDGGLYMPEEIPKLPSNLFNLAEQPQLEDIAFEVEKLFLRQRYRQKF